MTADAVPGRMSSVLIRVSVLYSCGNANFVVAQIWLEMLCSNAEYRWWHLQRGIFGAWPLGQTIFAELGWGKVTACAGGGWRGT